MWRRRVRCPLVIQQMLYLGRRGVASCGGLARRRRGICSIQDVLDGGGRGVASCGASDHTPLRELSLVLIEQILDD